MIVCRQQRSETPQDLACYKESCVSKWAVATSCTGWGICPLWSPLKGLTIQESYFQLPEAGSESWSEQASRPGTPGAMDVPGWEGGHRPGGRKEAWGKRKGGDPLPNKTGGRQPPEAGDISTDVPLGPPSAHTWGPGRGQEWLLAPTSNPVYCPGVTTEHVTDPTLGS